MILLGLPYFVFYARLERMSNKPLVQIQAEKEDLPKNSIKLKITVPASEWSRFEMQTVSQLAPTVNLPGFRKGKVPVDLVKNQIEEEKIAQEIMEKVLPLSYVEAIKKFALKPVGSPQIKIIQFEKGKDFKYEAELSLWPKVKLVNYKKIKISRPKIKLKKEAIKKELEILQKRLADHKVKKNGAKVGDQLLISYKGKINDKTIPELNKEKIWIVLEENALFPGFGKKLLTQKAGAESTFNLKVEKNFIRQGLAGQNINFWVKIFEVREEIPISLEKVAKKLGHKNKKELEEKIKGFLEQEKEKENEREWETKITNELIRQTEVEISPQLINQESQRLLQQISSDLSLRGQSLEQALAQTKNSKKEFEQQLKKQAEKNLKNSFILNEIAQREKITTSTKEVDKVMEKERIILASQGYKLEEIKEYLDKEETRNQLRADLRVKKVLDFLKSLNK